MVDRDPPTSTAQRLGGRYRLRAVLGRGGMATVYRATDEVLQRDVAVKVLHAHLADDPAFLDRFRREARAAAALSHPNVVAVFDWGESAEGVYLVMELVEGFSLRQVLRQRGRLSPGEALALLGPVAQGVATAHRAGIVHRDVKPENVLISADGAVKVTDFGLARAAATASQTFGPGALAGSPHYVAPEAVQGGRLDARSDVYALGIILYECLVGAPPLEGETPTATALQHARRQVPPPSQAVPELTSDVDEVVRRATAADPDGRHADAADFAAALRAAVPAGPAPVDLHDDGTDTVVLPTAATDTVVQEAPPRPRRRRRRLGLAVLALLALAGGGYALWATVIAPLQPVPAVRGATEAAATRTLQDAGFEVSVAEERPHDGEVPADRVLTTDPEDRARRGSTVQLVLSAGPRQVEVPEVAGAEEAAARQELDRAGLEVQVQGVFHEQIGEGLAVGTRPQAGQAVDEGSEVALLVSKGRKPISVPDLTGVPEAQARSQLGELGLKGKVVDRVHHPDIPAGAVVEQDPPASKTLFRGQTVELVVSQGPETFPMPDVTGEPEGKAVRILERAGLKPTVLYQDTIFGFRSGKVADQDPSAKTPVAEGDEVTIWVWR